MVSGQWQTSGKSVSEMNAQIMRTTAEKKIDTSPLFLPRKFVFSRTSLTRPPATLSRSRERGVSFEAERKFADRTFIRLHPIPAVVTLPSSPRYAVTSWRGKSAGQFVFVSPQQDKGEL